MGPGRCRTAARPLQWPPQEGHTVRLVPWLVAIVIVMAGSLGPVARAEDPGPEGEKRRVEDRLEDEAKRLGEPVGYCLAGSPCAEHPEFKGPPACLAADDLGVCSSRGAVEPAE